MRGIESGQLLFLRERRSRQKKLACHGETHNADDFQIRLPDKSVFAGLDRVRDWSKGLNSAVAEC